MRPEATPVERYATLPRRERAALMREALFDLLAAAARRGAERPSYAELADQLGSAASAVEWWTKRLRDDKRVFIDKAKGLVLLEGQARGIRLAPPTSILRIPRRSSGPVPDRNPLPVPVRPMLFVSFTHQEDCIVKQGEVIVPGDLWAALRNEAEASGLALSLVIADVIKLGIAVRAEDRAEAQMVRPGMAGEMIYLSGRS